MPVVRPVRRLITQRFAIPAGEQPWSPLDATGLVSWHDPSDSDTVTIATGVSQLDDKSGNGFHLVNGTGGTQPALAAAEVNGLDVIDFSAGSKVLSMENTFSFTGDEATVYMIVRPGGSAGSHQWAIGMRGSDAQTSYGDPEGAQWYMEDNAGNEGTQYDDAFEVDLGGTLSRAIPTLYVVQRDGTAWSGRKNGVAVTGGTSVGTAFASNDLGWGRAPGVWDNYHGIIGEVIMCAAVHDAAEIEQIETYLLDKWAWTPLNLTGLAAWWDASDEDTITEAGGLVSQWDDKSGNARHATQGTGANQPTTGTRTINGLNVLDFDGSGDQMDATLTCDPTDRFVAAVVNIDASTGGDQELVGGPGADAFAWRIVIFNGNSTQSIMETAVNTHVIAADGRSMGTDYILGVQYDSGANKAWTNGTAHATNTDSFTYSSGSTAFRIGRGETNNRIDGMLGELIVVDAVLSSDEKDALWAYLNEKWAVY